MEIASKLRELVRERVRPDDPGVVIGVYADGRLTHEAAVGLASVGFGVPVDARTRFDIASMSKQFTAAAALLLCRDGKLALDEDIRVHLPELKLTAPVTVGQCLRHTGGLREWLALTTLAGRPLTRITQHQTLALIAGVTGLNFEPGTGFAYSNTGYVLVASLVHRITGKTLGEFTAERIFAPLGMDETVFRENSQLPLGGYAEGYCVHDGNLLRADTEECAVGDGGLATSIADLAPWFGFLQDGRVLGADVRDALLERGGGEGTGPRPYALGLHHTSIDGLPAFGHSGAVTGYRSQLLFLPGQDIGVAVLTNNSSVDPVLVADEGLRLAAGLPAEEPARWVDGTAAAAELAGCWVDAGTDLSVQVEAAESGRIRLAGSFPDRQFAFAGDGTWHGLGRFAATKIRVEGERILISSLHGPGHTTAYRRCDPPASGERLTPAVYYSPELGVLARITDRDELELGLELVAPIQAAPDGAFSAGGSLTLRPDGEDLLVSTGGIYRMKFLRQPDTTVPVGIPSGLRPCP